MNEGQFYASVLGNYVKANGMRAIWNKGGLTSPYFVGKKIHTAYERSMSFEIASFVRDAMAFEGKIKRPGTTKQILAMNHLTAGKSSSDGATYGTLLGLLTRERVDGQFVYSITRKGRNFVTGKARVPRSFCLMEKIIFAYATEGVSFQEAMGMSSKHAVFKGSKAAHLKAVKATDGNSL